MVRKTSIRHIGGREGFPAVGTTRPDLVRQPRLLDV